MKHGLKFWHLSPKIINSSVLIYYRKCLLALSKRRRHLLWIFWIFDIDVHGCHNWRPLVASVHNNRCNWCQLSELGLASWLWWVPGPGGGWPRLPGGQLDKESDTEDTWRIQPRAESESEGRLVVIISRGGGWRQLAAPAPAAADSWHTRGCSSCSCGSMTPLEDSCGSHSWQLNTSWCCSGGGWTRCWGHAGHAGTRGSGACRPS